jgi:Nif-specific regulatory protein
MSGSEQVSASDLPVSLSLRRTKGMAKSSSLTADVGEIEKSNIREALEKTGWVQAKAARLLGITPRQIGYKIKKYGLEENTV